MPDKPKKLRIFTGSGSLIALAIAAVMVLGIVGPILGAVLQFRRISAAAAAIPRWRRVRRWVGAGWWGFGGGWFGNDRFEPFQQRAPQPRWERRQTVAPAREDFSKAPPPEKRDTIPERHILVLGDAMADWLAYGLEDAYADQPEMGVIRRHKTVSGLIKYSPKGEPADWAAAAKGILATEKADAIVVMLGLEDRVAIREPAADKPDNKSPDKKDAKKDDKAKPDGKPSDAKSAAKPDAVGKPDGKATDSELSPDDAADNSDAPPVMASENSARSPNGLYEFREERWVELYRKKIEEMIGVLKSKGVPVLWVGLPVVSWPQGDRRHAVPGFALSRRGRQGRHHICRCLGRLCRRSRPLPAEGPGLRRSDPTAALLRRRVFHQGRRAQARALCRARNHAAVRGAFRADRAADRACDARRQCLPGQPAPRPLAGPILPLVASSVGTDQLLGGPGNATGRGRCARRTYAGQG